MQQVRSQYEAALELLAAGAVIEQTSEVSLAYRLKVGRDVVSIAGGLVQQLLTRGRIRPTCRVSGRLRYVAT